MVHDLSLKWLPRIYNISNMTGTTIGAGSAYSSGAPVFTAVYYGVCVADL
jgi:hypothetical protein